MRYYRYNIGFLRYVIPITDMAQISISAADIRADPIIGTPLERVQRKPHRQLIACPQIGEVVLIKDNLPPGRWKVGKVSELIVGRDQRVRSAKVLVAPHRYLHRPLSLLYPLECPDGGDNGDNQMCNNQGDHSMPTAKIRQ